MKNKINLLLIFASFILFANLSLAEEINFESNTIDILNKGELIKATGNVKAIVDSGLIISGDVAEYDKKKSILSIFENCFTALIVSPPPIIALYIFIISQID